MNAYLPSKLPVNTFNIVNAFLELPRSSPVPPAAKAHLALYWEELLVLFAHSNHAAAEDAAAAAAPRVVDSAKDQQVMGVVTAWAVSSSRAVAAKPRAAKADAAMLPLLDSLLIENGVAGLVERHGEHDPTVLFLMARQQYGGYHAVTSPTLTVFSLAQAELSSLLTPADIAQSGPYAFQLAVDHVKGCASVMNGFRGLFNACTLPADPKEADALVQRCVDKLLSKFFNQAGAEFRTQVESIWGSANGKGGIAIRTELKVLQQKAADKIQQTCPVSFQADTALKLEPANLHRLLSLVVHMDPQTITKGSQKCHLQRLLLAYAEVDRDVKLGETKDKLAEQLFRFIKASQATGFSRPELLCMEAPLATRVERERDGGDCEEGQGPVVDRDVDGCSGAGHMTPLAQGLTAAAARAEAREHRICDERAREGSSPRGEASPSKAPQRGRTPLTPRSASSAQRRA